MRHGNAFRKFGRSPAHRRAMFRNMATSLLLNERCNTTVEKAKDLRRVVEKLITLGGTDTLHARRQAYAYIMDKAVVHKLFAEIGPRFKARPGGYTRVVKAGHRHGDAANLAVIELVGEAEKKAPAKAKKPAKTDKAAAPKKTAKAPKKAAAEKTVEA